MKFVDEYRNREACEAYADRIAQATTRPWTIMEICGGQTHSILKHGLEEMLPAETHLLHGPGCPVCVTPIEQIDKALQLAQRPEVILCSYGDMLRVPGSSGDLFSAKARGGDVRILYSPLDALKTAKENPDREVVFFAVGFETTAPAHALAVLQAADRKLPNFSLLVSHVRVPPAIAAIMESPGCGINGFLAAGHVCTVMGTSEYEALSTKYHIPFVVTGFEPLDILRGLYACILQLEHGAAKVENQYQRCVRTEGNPIARERMAQVFEVVDRNWRGIGNIANSGLRLRPEYSAFDAEVKFVVSNSAAEENKDCIAGLILQGKKYPYQCPAFGRACTPERPLGAPMVSSEGTCAAYFRYQRRAG